MTGKHNVTKIRVCSGSNCGPAGGHGLVRDVEELCGDGINVEPTQCLGRCGEGPNVEICKGGRESIVTGVNAFKRVEKLALDHCNGSQLGEFQRKVCKLKYDARRLEEPSQRMAKLKQAFELLGGEGEEAEANEPALLADLLLMRSLENARIDHAASAADAARTIGLTPNRAIAHEVLGDALERMDKLPEASEAMQKALSLRVGIEESAVKRKIKRIDRKLKQNVQPEPTVVADAETADVNVSGEKVDEEVEDAGNGDGPDPADVAAAAFAAVSSAMEDDTGIAAAVIGFVPWVVNETSWLNKNCVRLVLSGPKIPKPTYERLDELEPLPPDIDMWHIDICAELAQGGKDDEEKEEIIRSYTPLSSMEHFRQGRLELMVKVYRQGRMSQHLGSLALGAKVLVSEPLVTNVTTAELLQGVVMIAGGSAVTVAMQVCAAALRSGVAINLALCVHSEDDIIFKDRFDALQRMFRHFRVAYCVSEGLSSSTNGKTGRADFFAGRLKPGALLPDLGISRSAMVAKRPFAIVSGPPGLCLAGQNMLQQLGWVPESIRLLDAAASCGGVHEPFDEAQVFSGESQQPHVIVAQDHSSRVWSVLRDVVMCRRRCLGHANADKEACDDDALRATAGGVV
eukprot:TRINITY_DN75578_c0_g1_i1.p1 TRINITY_DN75578_c0_g1~~TRINITY_DN75578_c0_g1_i1.p1  ORF type:complete len:648 (-),score=112.43 TRINITY_DN75578_c0_g1_i1:155-2041(-)